MGVKLNKNSMIAKLLKIKTSTIAFIVVVPLLTVTSIITAPCPVCNGTGTLATTPGMENVEITEYSTYEWRITRDSCGLYILYFYDIDITLFNKQSEAVAGWLKLTLVDISNPDRIPIVDTQYRPIELSGMSVVNLSYMVVFGTGLDAFGQTEVRINIMTGDVPDILCKGSGRVPLNTWLFINGLKDTFVEQIREEADYRPPIEIPWEERTGE